MTRIAIASDDGRAVAAHTGRCACFVVFDVHGETLERIDCRSNTFTAHARGQCSGHAVSQPHGHSDHAPLVGAIADCCALITRGLGARLVADLASQGIEAYVTTATEVERAAQAFAAGQLPRAAERGCCQHD
jgi:predicted Fe-Mo cluster-binding NifX family protein